MEALAEDDRGRALGPAHDAHDPVEMARMPGARLAQRRDHPGEVGRADAHRDEGVVDLRPTHPVVARAHDRRQVGRRVARAVLRAADEAQHARGLVHAVDLEGVEAGRRHDGVEHQPGHAVGMGDRVALGHEGAVGDAVERELVGPERDPQRVEVRDRVGGRVEAPPRAERLLRRPRRCRAAAR